MHLTKVIVFAFLASLIVFGEVDPVEKAKSNAELMVEITRPTREKAVKEIRNAEGKISEILNKTNPTSEEIRAAIDEHKGAVEALSNIEKTIRACADTAKEEMRQKIIQDGKVTGEFTKWYRNITRSIPTFDFQLVFRAINALHLAVIRETEEKSGKGQI